MGLSSSWLAPLLPFDPADRTVCYITTAAAFGGEVPDWIKNEIEALEKIGFDVDEVDLTHVEVEQLDETFAGCDLYWVGGGNTLYLLQEVRRSGFDDFVTGKILEGVPYVGVSAGSVIMGPDIEFELFSSRTPELTSYEGLDLFPFAPFVHFGNPEYKSIYKDILDHSLDAGLSFITVSDSQFIYVTGNKWEVMNIE